MHTSGGMYLVAASETWGTRPASLFTSCQQTHCMCREARVIPQQGK